MSWSALVKCECECKSVMVRMGFGWLLAAESVRKREAGSRTPKRGAKGRKGREGRGGGLKSKRISSERPIRPQGNEQYTNLDGERERPRRRNSKGKDSYSFAPATSTRTSAHFLRAKVQTQNLVV